MKTPKKTTRGTDETFLKLMTITGSSLLKLLGVPKEQAEKYQFTRSHALAWECLLDAPASWDVKIGRWRVPNGLPRRRVGTSKGLLINTFANSRTYNKVFN